MDLLKLAFPFCACLAALAVAAAQDRMPPLPQEKMTDTQKNATADLMAGRHNGVIGPYISLMRSPTLLRHVYEMGGYLRFEGPMKGRLTELVTLLAARHWTQQFEFNAHQPLALNAGLKKTTIAAIAEGRRPSGLPEDEEIVYDLITELNTNQSVSDATYARSTAKFGEQGVIDLIGVNGFYAMLAMFMNVARTPLPAGQAPPLTPFPR